MHGVLASENKSIFVFARHVAVVPKLAYFHNMYSAHHVEVVVDRH